MSVCQTVRPGIFSCDVLKRKKSKKVFSFEVLDPGTIVTISIFAKNTNASSK